MYRFHFFLSSNTKVSFYFALIYPYLAYCTTVWSSAYVTNLNCIFLLQKRAVQAMTNSNHLAPSAHLFAQYFLSELPLYYKIYVFLSTSFAAPALSKFVSD